MTRRKNRRGRTATRAGLSLFQRVLNSHFAVFTADLVEPDGVSGKTRRVIDWKNPARYLEQTVDANQCALPAPHADFGGNLCLTCSGAQWYVWNGPSSDWGFLHAGGGSEYAWVGTNTTSATKILFSTFSTSTGADTLITAGNSMLTRAYNNSAVQFAGVSGFTAPVGTPFVVQMRHASAASPNVTAKRSGVSEQTAAYTAAVGSGSPQANFRLFARGDNAFPHSGRWRAFLVADKILSTQERADRDAWLLSVTGLAA